MVLTKLGTLYRKWENWILPALFVLILLLLLGLRFDYYYDLNDDVLMKDILSGVYTGAFESRNVQMLFPLSLILSFGCRIFGTSYVYGLFLCICQFGSLYVILYRSMGYAEKSMGKAALGLLESLLFAALLLPQLVFVQYTVTSGLLTAAAVFWFLTGKKAEAEKSAGGFLKKNLPPVLLCILAFLLRPEMLILLLPLAGVAGLWKWAEERPVFTKKNAACYLGVFGLILAGLLSGQAANGIAYGSAEWKEFFRLFDARTEVYDFKTADILKYEENKEFYDSLGLTEEEAALLGNYNYGVDDRIDAGLMERISAYALEKEGYFGKSLREGLWLYKARLSNTPGLDFDAEQEFPFLLTEAVLIVLLLLAAYLGKRAALLWQLLLFGGVRSALWMYLILRNRVPVRISHPLYFAEIVMLAAWLLHYLKDGQFTAKEKLSARRWLNPVYVSAVLLFVTAISLFPRSMEKTGEEYASREGLNRTDTAARAYYRGHPENLYLADVYSTVQFSEKMFRDGETHLGNYDLLGGWLCKSPLAEKKLEAFGYVSLEDALVNGENVRLVSLKGESWEWLEAYFRERGLVIRVIMEERIPGGTEGNELEVYWLQKEEIS